MTMPSSLYLNVNSVKEAAMEYTCVYQSGKQKQTWQGEIQLLHRDGSTIEAGISGRGTYFHVIVGRHCYGNYICIPNYDIGCELSDYSDIFWNRERLSRHLKKVDAATVACALVHLKEL